MPNRSKSNKSGSGSPRQNVPVGNVDAEHDYESSVSDLTLVDLHNTISALSNKICGKLDHLTDEFRAMSRKVEDLEGAVEINSEKITKLETHVIPGVVKHSKDLDNKITLMEIYSRKNNLLFYGIKESQTEDVFDVLRKAFITLGLDEKRAAGISLINAHRLPRRSPNGESPVSSQSKGSPPVPIIAKFVTIPDRDAVLNAFEQQQRLRGRESAAQAGPAPNRITVRTDLPPALKVRRGVLATEAFKLRRERGVATKIVLQGAKVVLMWKEKGTTRWNVHE